MSKDQNITAQILMADSIIAGDLAALDSVFAPNVIEHNPVKGQAPGLRFYKSPIGFSTEPSPDLSYVIHRTVADENDACIAFTLSGMLTKTFEDLELLTEPLVFRMSEFHVLMSTNESLNAGEP